MPLPLHTIFLFRFPTALAYSRKISIFRERKYSFVSVMHNLYLSILVHHRIIRASLRPKCRRSKSRSPRRAGGILAQSLSLVTGPPHIAHKSAMVPPMPPFWGGEVLPSLFSLLPPKKRLAFRVVGTSGGRRQIRRKSRQPVLWQ